MDLIQITQLIQTSLFLQSVIQAILYRVKDEIYLKGFLFTSEPELVLMSLINSQNNVGRGDYKTLRHKHLVLGRILFLLFMRNYYYIISPLII